MMLRLFGAGLFMAAAALILVEIGKRSYGSQQVGQRWPWWASRS